jgi:hypothetical protein
MFLFKTKYLRSYDLVHHRNREGIKKKEKKRQR